LVHVSSICSVPYHSNIINKFVHQITTCDSYENEFEYFLLAKKMSHSLKKKEWHENRDFPVPFTCYGYTGLPMNHSALCHVPYTLLPVFCYLPARTIDNRLGVKFYFGSK